MHFISFVNNIGIFLCRVLLYCFNCMQGLGELAERFPGIADTSVRYLTDFLVDPSPILLRLYTPASAVPSVHHAGGEYKCSRFFL